MAHETDIPDTARAVAALKTKAFNADEAVVGIERHPV